MDLPLLSASFLTFALTLYVILDGFDLGVGILLLLQPAMPSRDHMVDSITPTWDGNETWIIMAGVTVLAAFPVAYAILLPRCTFQLFSCCSRWAFVVSRLSSACRRSGIVVNATLRLRLAR